MSDTTKTKKLKTGAEYKASLDDGRKVWIQGELLNKVTDDPGLGAGIDVLAEMFDDQFKPEFEDATTYYEPEVDAIITRSWQAPKSLQELQERRKMVEYTTKKTAGTYGRPPDLGPTIAIGLLAHLSDFQGKKSLYDECQPDFAQNVLNYVREGRLNNLTCAESLAGPQNDRSKPHAQAASLVRVVGVEKDGVRISGAKSVGSIAAQANEVFFTNLSYAESPPEACIWGALPLSTPGLKLVSRETVSNPGADPFDHPLTHRGEESDQLVIFDNVLLPKDRIFNLGDAGLNQSYGKVALWAHWHILSRLAVRAEIFVGTAQMVLNVLGTGHIPGVQALFAELISYAQTLRAFVIAAEYKHTFTDQGIIQPDLQLMTAGRMHSVKYYPHVIHTLQELCGQGLVMRFGKKAFENPDIGHHLHEMLPGRDCTAMEKERVMNFVWDLTSSSLAGRVELFENVNAGATPSLLARLFNEYNRDEHVKTARKLAGFD